MSASFYKGFFQKEFPLICPFIKYIRFSSGSKKYIILYPQLNIGRGYCQGGIVTCSKAKPVWLKVVSLKPPSIRFAHV